MGFMLPVGSVLISVILFTSSENAPLERSFAAACGSGRHQAVGPRCFSRSHNHSEHAALLRSADDDVAVMLAGNGHVVAGDNGRDLVHGHVMPCDMCGPVLLNHQSFYN